MRIAGNNEYRARTDDGRLISRATELRTPGKKLPFDEKALPDLRQFRLLGMLMLRCRSLPADFHLALFENRLLVACATQIDQNSAIELSNEKRVG